MTSNINPDFPQEVHAYTANMRQNFEHAKTEIEALQQVIAPGMVRAWPSAAAPAGWLLCSGQEVSQVQYADLFAVIGSMYGSAAAGMFRLPELRDKMPAGAGATVAVATTGGANSVAITEAEMGTHDHGATSLAGAHTHTTGAAGTHSHTSTSDSSGEHTHSTTINSGGSHAHSGTSSVAGSHTHTVTVHVLPNTTTNANVNYSSQAYTSALSQNFVTASSGAHTHTGSTASAGSHSHTVTLATSSTHTHTGTSGEGGAHSHTVTSDAGHAHSTEASGSGTAHENRPPFLALNFIIKV